MKKKYYHKIFHIDVNSAYLSWEAAYRLQRGASVDLRDIPSAVGGDKDKRRGIVLAKSIPAKAFDIKTGEPLGSALDKCPQLEVVPANFERYLIASQALMDLVEGYSPLVQRFSVDEMFLDYQGSMDPVLYADMIRKDVKKTLGFTVNIGIGDNKLLAKMASDFKKPDMTHTLYKEEIPTKMWPLYIRDLFMIGSRTEAKLLSRGIETIGDLARLSPDYIYRWLKKPGLTIWEYANGLEFSPVDPSSSPVKSIGNSTTTPFDVDTEKEALMFILALSEMVGLRLRALGLKAQRISISLKYKDFTGFSTQRKTFSPMESTNSIYEEAKDLFQGFWNKDPLRQLGVRVSSLVTSDSWQMSLFSKEEDPVELSRTIDGIRQEYGLGSIYRSSFLNSGIAPIIGGTQEDLDYPVMTSRLD